MKQLILLRHAKSSWDDSVARDFDRPLNEKGLRAARTMGRHAAELGLKWDEAVASPAARVTETIAGFGEGYGSPLNPRAERAIYMADVGALLEVLAGCKGDTVLLAGHNPGLEDLVFYLTPKDDGPARREVDVKYPTASIAQLSIPVDDWRDLKEDGAHLERFLRPRDVDPALGPDKD